jgi:AcrR family transcriptional regulator
MKPQIKLEARARKAQILSAALSLAPSRGYACLTRDEVAAAAGIPSSLVAYHMGTMQAFKRDLMREAIRVECLPVIAQGLACKDPHALKASDDLRARAAASLT